MVIRPDLIHPKEIIVPEIVHMAIRLGICRNYMRRKEIDRTEVIKGGTDRIILRTNIIPRVGLFLQFHHVSQIALMYFQVNEFIHFHLQIIHDLQRIEGR